MDINKTSPIELMDNCRKIRIPFYQRDYSWDVENVEKLLSDIYYSKTESYFLGSIILKKGRGFENIIIDGQQRISTIILIYKIIWKYREWLSNETKYKLENLYNKIEFNSSNLKDGRVLYKIIKSEDESFDKRITLTKYYENYQAIDNFILGKPNIDKVIGGLYKQLEKVVLSQVIVDQDIDEHILFSQINSTGKNLSAFDLMKNYLFSHISNELEGDVNKEEKISNMLEKLERVSVVKSKDDVIRHFIGFETVNLQNKNPKNIYVKFVKLHEEKYQGKSLILFDDLYKFFFYYSYLENRKWEKNEDFSSILNTLIESLGTYAILIITFFYENSRIRNEEINMTNEEIEVIKNCLLILESYKFKREFCGNSEKTITRYIPRLSSEILKNFNDFSTDIKLYFFLVYSPNPDVSYRIPTNKEFKRGMTETNMYKKITKWFLYRISNSIFKDKLYFKYLTIEHIMPQKQKQLNGSVQDKDEELIASKIHTIGNLTLTHRDYNSTLSNKSFKEKKEILKKKDSFPLNKYFINLESEIWDIKEIEKRSNILFEMCQNLWYFDKYQKIIIENEIFTNYKEEKDVTKEKLAIDYGAKNGYTFNKNISNFKNIKDLINISNIKIVLKNFMVHAYSTEKNEKEVFNIKKEGWVSQAIYDYFCLSSKEVKGKYSESDFNDFIKSKTEIIEWFIADVKRKFD